MDFQSRSLVQQGYSHLTEEQIQSIKWGLRFTPTTCMLAAFVALWFQSVPALLALAVLGIVPFWFPTWHPVDRLYNHVIAPMIGATRLPPNPFPRRIACVSAGIMNTIAAIFLLNGMVAAAWITGGTLLVLQVIVNTTHFCLASFFIEQGLKLAGKSLPIALIDPAAARAMKTDGAVLIDVRDESEFAMGAIEGAENIPVSKIQDAVEGIKERGKPVILYCLSGGRCRLAHAKLVDGGVVGIHVLGAMDRWES